MCLNIESLPDDCLLPIFDLIPLSDLLNLDQVCSRWAKLLPSACARRRTLVLILGGKRLDKMDFHIPFNATFEVSLDGWEPYFDLPVLERENSLTLPFFIPITSRDVPTETDFTELARLHHARLSGQLVTYLTELFQNVNSLVLLHTECDEDELRSVIKLLGPSWSLKTLKLWIRTRNIDIKYFDRPEHHPLHTLLHSINQQSNNSLQQLTLDIGCGGLDITLPIDSYSFISQLKVLELSLGKYDQGNTIWEIMYRFNSAELSHICMGNDEIKIEDALNPKFSEFTNKVCQLYSEFSWTVEQLGEFCWRFSSLTSLRLVWSPSIINFTQLVTNLASLKQLTHLKLEIIFEQQQPENLFELVDRDDEEEELCRMSLQKVKVLELVSDQSSHQHFESLSPLVFPSVEVIILWNSDGPYASSRHLRLLILSLKNKFGNKLERLYAKRSGYGGSFVDWTNCVLTETDDDFPA